MWKILDFKKILDLQGVELIKVNNQQRKVDSPPPLQGAPEPVSELTGLCGVSTRL